MGTRMLRHWPTLHSCKQCFCIWHCWWCYVIASFSRQELVSWYDSPVWVRFSSKLQVGLNWNLVPTVVKNMHGWSDQHKTNDKCIFIFIPYFAGRLSHLKGVWNFLDTPQCMLRSDLGWFKLRVLNAPLTENKLNINCQKITNQHQIYSKPWSYYSNKCAQKYIWFCNYKWGISKE
jgi:hypothetical protein